MTDSRRSFISFGAKLVAGACVPMTFARSALAEQSIRIGYQKFNTINLLKGTGQLEKALAPLGVSVKWVEFPSAPATYEALNTGNIDIAHAADTNTVFAQSSGVNFAYLAVEVPNPKGLAILVKKDSPILSVRAWHSSPARSTRWACGNRFSPRLN